LNLKQQFSQASDAGSIPIGSTILHGQRKSRLLKTKNREKYAVWIDNDDLDRLREYQQAVGVPVSESVRRAIKAYLEILANRRRA
jgi:Ribbon-helix-helix domain